MTTTLRRAVLATALAGIGLASTAGAAFAGENQSTDHHGTEKTSQEGLVNVGDVQTVVPLNACNNDIPVNALGVQVPIQNLGLDIPLLSPTDGDGHAAGNAAAVPKTCGNGTGADN